MFWYICLHALPNPVFLFSPPRPLSFHVCAHMYLLWAGCSGHAFDHLDPVVSQDWGNRLLEGTDRTLCAPGERSSDPARGRASLACAYSESPVQAWVHSTCRGARDWLRQSWEVQHVGIGPFGGGHHYLCQSQTIGREHSPTSQQKIKDLLSMDLPTRARSSFPHN